MLYKFQSKACGDVIMLAAHGDALLRLLGREPAARGIFEPAHMPALLAQLDAALAQADAAASDTGHGDAAAGSQAEADVQAGTHAVGLRQRLWPIVDMLRRSHAAGEPVVWGV